MGGPYAPESPKITPEELMGKTRTEIRSLARQKGLLPTRRVDEIGQPRQWKDPVTEKERLRLDRGHVDKKTDQAFDDPNAAVDHAHGYESDGKTKIRNPEDNNPHFPTVGE